MAERKKGGLVDSKSSNRVLLLARQRGEVGRITFPRGGKNIFIF